MPDRNPDSIYGVICTENVYGEAGCGSQGLTNKEYNKQMSLPDKTWRCPVCRAEAWWDDERYEQGLVKQENSNG